MEYQYFINKRYANTHIQVYIYTYMHVHRVQWRYNFGSLVNIFAVNDLYKLTHHHFHHAPCFVVRTMKIRSRGTHFKYTTYIVLLTKVTKEHMRSLEAVHLLRWTTCALISIFSLGFHFIKIWGGSIYFFIVNTTLIIKSSIILPLHVQVFRVYV